MSHQPSTRIQNVQTPMIPVVGEWIAQHPGTISLGQGVVHYRSPKQARQAAIQSAENPRVDGYALVRGIDELLVQIETKVARENGIPTEAQTCVVTAGSNMAFQTAVLAIADVGDEIILISPFYFNHEMAVDIAGCRTVTVPTDENYQIDFDSLQNAITKRTRAIVTVSPGNPTGTILSQASLEQVNRLCHEKGLYHISDEAYEYFVYDGKQHFSPGSLPNAANHTISLYTLSKAYGMAGWRCGYMAAPKHLEVGIKKIQDTNLVCPPIINQLAAAAAMKAGSDWCQSRIEGFQNVRDLVIDELASIKGVDIPTPEGAFYALMRLDTERTDLDIVETLIRDNGIAVMPGQTFGVTEGCSLRIAYGALDRDTVSEGVGRLKTGLSKLL